jgi:hypothetical protein
MLGIWFIRAGDARRGPGLESDDVDVDKTALSKADVKAQQDSRNTRRQYWLVKMVDLLRLMARHIAVWCKLETCHVLRHPWSS